ncbi:MAG: antitoxin [Ornithinibacter sp.]
MTTTDQLRNALRDLEAKAREMDLEAKLTTFADQADHYLQLAATKAGELAHDNRERIDDQLTKAGAAVDGRTDGKYASYVGKLHVGVMSGVDWVADQRTTPTSTSPGTAPGATASQPTDAAAGSATTDGGSSASSTERNEP